MSSWTSSRRAGPRSGSPSRSASSSSSAASGPRRRPSSASGRISRDGACANGPSPPSGPTPPSTRDGGAGRGDGPERRWRRSSGGPTGCPGTTTAPCARMSAGGWGGARSRSSAEPWTRAGTSPRTSRESTRRTSRWTTPTPTSSPIPSRARICRRRGGSPAWAGGRGRASYGRWRGSSSNAAGRGRTSS